MTNERGPRQVGFVGDRHVEILRQLRSTLTRCVTDGPQFVLMTGASGVGKTRIIQELYRSMAPGQGSPAYWPKSLVDSTAAGGEPLLGRKVIAPDPESFVWASEALPTFAWWGFSCERLKDGSLREPGLGARPDIHAHTLPLQMALARGPAGRRRRVTADLRRRAREALAETSLEAASMVLADAGLPVPGIGLVVKWAADAKRGAREKRANLRRMNQDVNVGGELAESSRSQSVELARFIAEMSSAQVPAVVVVEDLHAAGLDLLTTLVALSESRSANVLVVANSWPESTRQPGLQRLFEQWEAVGAFQHHDVPTLGFEDLARLASGHVPSIGRFEMEWLAETYPNPLALGVYLTLPSIQAQVARDGGVFTAPGGASRVPRSVSDVYRDRWRELSPVARRVLALAAVTDMGPEESLREFLPSLVARAAQESGATDPFTRGEIAMALGACVSEYGWLRRYGNGWSFTELLLAAAASEAADEELDAVAIDRFQRALRAALIEQIWPHGIRDVHMAAERDTDQVSEIFAQWKVPRLQMVLRLTPHDEWGSEQMALPVLTHVFTLAAEGYRTSALELVRRHEPLRHLPSAEVRFELEREVAEWLVERGEIEEALRLMTSVVRRWEERSPGLIGMDATLLYADLLGRTGRPDEAWEALVGVDDTFHDYRVDGVKWLGASQGWEVAERFLLDLLTDAEADVLAGNVGVDASADAGSDAGRELARLCEERGDHDLAAGYRVRAQDLDDVLQALRHARLPHWQRVRGPAPEDEYDHEYDFDLDVDRSFWGTGWTTRLVEDLCREGRDDEALLWAESFMATIPDAERHGVWYVTFLMQYARLLLSARELRGAATALGEALNHPEAFGEGDGIATRIDRSIFLPKPGEDPEATYHRLEDVLTDVALQVRDPPPLKNQL